MTLPNPPHSTSIHDALEMCPTQIEKLFDCYDFITELKSLNPKLSYYLRDCPHLIHQAICFITTPPQQTDSELRKYKYPLLSVQMMQAENPAIIQSFFPSQNKQIQLLNALFSPIFDENTQILHLLGSYLHRAIKSLFKTKSIQMLEIVYSNTQILKYLVHQSSNKSLQVLLQAFLNLDFTRDRSSEKRLNTKIEIVSLIIQIFRNDPEAQKGSNLSDYLIDLVEKYHLISDGKRMVDLVLNEENIAWLLQNVQYQSVTRLLKSITNYYCMNILNNQEPQILTNSNNIQILEREPFIMAISAWIPRLLQNQFSYKYYRVVEFICHSICIRSNTILNSIISSRFFQSTLSLFFRTDANIFHSLIQKTIAHIFYCQKPIYNLYRQHLFCDVNIIISTAGRIEDLKFGDLMSKSYAGYLISMIKIFSKIQTNNPRIRQVIQRNQECWMKVMGGHLKIYQEITKKEMGTYQIEQSIRPIEYKVTKRSETDGRLITQNHQLFQDNNKQNSRIANPLADLISTAKLSSSIQQVTQLEIVTKFTQQSKQNNFFMSQTSKQNLNTVQLNPENKIIQKQPISLTSNILTETHKKQLLEQIRPSAIKQQRVVNAPSSFDQFMKKASRQAEQMLRIRRSSVQRQATPSNKGLSPALSRKSWTGSSAEKIPMRIVSSPSDKYLHSVRVKMALSSPQQSESKRFRQMETKDIPLLSFLGVLKK